MGSSNYAVITMLASGVVTKKIQKKEPTLDQLQKAVGGFIERVPGFTSCTFQDEKYTRGTCYTNEDGRTRGLSYNERATEEWWACLRDASVLEAILVGDVVFVARTEEGADA